jgi:glycosyltransferase involved in cell wall biosynthesis
MISDETNSFVPVIGGSVQTAGSFLHEPTTGFLSVIIPVYKDAEGLAVTLRSLQTQSWPRANCEILVANDGADPQVSELCDGMGVTEVSLPVNRGSYAARNAALAHARGEWIAFADADVRVDPRWCETGCAGLADSDLVAGRTVIDLAGGRSMAGLFQVCFAFPAKHYACDLGMVQTVNLFARRRAFADAGFFDDRLRSGGDLEWSQRATGKAGKSVHYEESAVVYHPPRNYAQILASMERIIYGQENAKLLHGDRKEFLGTTNSTYRNLLPPSPKSIRQIRVATNSGREFLQLFFFCWWLKLRTLLTMFKVRRLLHRSNAASHSENPVTA